MNRATCRKVPALFGGSDQADWLLEGLMDRGAKSGRRELPLARPQAFLRIEDGRIAGFGCDDNVPRRSSVAKNDGALQSHQERGETSSDSGAGPGRPTECYEPSCFVVSAGRTSTSLDRGIFF